jgi:hypothetical protein
VNRRCDYATSDVIRKYAKRVSRTSFGSVAPFNGLERLYHDECWPEVDRLSQASPLWAMLNAGEGPEIRAGTGIR